LVVVVVQRLTQQQSH